MSACTTSDDDDDDDDGGGDDDDDDDDGVPRYRCYVIEHNASTAAFEKARSESGLASVEKEASELRRFPLRDVLEEFEKTGDGVW
jgi:hypothetical protein